MMNTKLWYQSKTVWFNIFTVLLAVANSLSGVISDPKVLSQIGMAVALINWGLRLVTKDRITSKDDDLLRGLLIVGVLGVSSMANSQEFVKAVQYDFQSHQVQPVIGHSLRPVRNLFGCKGIDAEIWGITSVKDDHVTFGSALVVKYKIFDGGYMFAGFSGQLAANHKAAAGVVLGVKISL